MEIDGYWLVSRNEPEYSDQYLHCANSDTFIMAGHRPLIRFGKRRAMLGTLRFFDPQGRPLDEAGEYTSRIRTGEAGWDAGGVSIRVGGPEGRHCAAVKISGGPVAVQFGGVHMAGEGIWNVCPRYEGNYLTVPFDPAQKGESYRPAEGGFDISRDEVDTYLLAHTGQALRLCLRASFPLRVEDDLANGVCPGEGYIAVSLCVPGEEPMDPREAFLSAESRSIRLCESLKIHTPDPRLDAFVAWQANHQDGIWYPPRNMHSDMQWNMPYLGWTNRYGNDVRGWHERTLAELQYYAPYQVRETGDRGPAWKADDHLGALPAAGSRFYGKGYIAQDQYFYNMQTQFFDQAIHSWRMTGDGEMARTLRPMLEMHCQWIDECFDPDGDGGYESVIDTWPTDSVWCDGGAAPEATCYAWRAHRAAADLARLGGDPEARERHEAACRKIAKAFFDLLWMRDKGVAGRCREALGSGRILENPWSYSIFLPIDVGLLDPLQAAQSLYYSKWAYQNDVTEHGRVLWHSNMVPMVWSVRWKGAEEQWMMAHAAFLAGFPEEALELLGGQMDEGGSVNGREVLEGLFGYRPDYPNGKVLLSPSMPFAWRDASLENSDVKLTYHRDGEKTEFAFSLFREADVTVELLIYAEGVTRVEGGTLLRMEPGFGRTKAVIACGRLQEGRVTVYTRGERAPRPSLEIEARPGEDVLLPCAFRPAAIHDPQGVVGGLRAAEDGMQLHVAEISGHHWLCAEKGGDMPEYQVYHLNISPTQAETERKERLHPALPEGAVYENLDLSPIFNCDVREIYKQKYLSPRPQTISARIGVDGYSPWTFTFWGCQPPEIGLNRTGKALLKDGVPVEVSRAARNIAFASLWDNFPDRVELNVGAKAHSVALLLCGTTNPMQCGVENARLIFRYTNGREEQVPLRNPDEFWSLCPLQAAPTSAEQDTYNDYDYASTPFCLPETPPETVQLGENCRAVAARWKLREDAELSSVTLEAVSREVVIGLMAATLIREK